MRSRKVLAVERDLTIDEGGIDIGEQRLDFLNSFPRVKPVIDLYTEVCGTRLSIAGVQGVNLLPDDQYLNLPHGNDFFLRLFGSKDRAETLDRVRSEARIFDSGNVSRAVAPAALIIRHLYDQSRNLDTARRNVMMQLISSLSMALLVLTMKLRSSPGTSYQLARSRLANEYTHLPILKDILGLIIDFDHRAESLLMLRRVKTEKGVNARMSNLVESAKQIKELIIQACLNLEEELLRARYQTHGTEIHDNLLNVALFIGESNSSQYQVISTLETAEEIVDPKAAWDRRHAKIRSTKETRALPEKVRVAEIAMKDPFKTEKSEQSSAVEDDLEPIDTASEVLRRTKV